MEAVANVCQFGVVELREEELMAIDGGWDWSDFGKAVFTGAVGGAVTGGLAGAKVGAIAGAVAGAATYAAGEAWDAIFSD